MNPVTLPETSEPLSPGQYGLAEHTYLMDMLGIEWQVDENAVWAASVNASAHRLNMCGENIETSL